MKRPLIIMLSIVGGMLVLTGLALGGYFYLKSASQPHTPKPPSASDLMSLRVDLPENTTNTKDGLIQFTCHLQAQDKDSKAEIGDIMPMVQDAVNKSMHKFANADLKTLDGQSRLEKDILQEVNALLPKGKVTEVYFSTWVVQ